MNNIDKQKYTDQKKYLLELVINGELSIDDIADDVRVLEFLEKCNPVMINSLFDSGAFHNIVEYYVRLALKASKVNATGEKIILNNLDYALNNVEASLVYRAALVRNNKNANL